MTNREFLTAIASAENLSADIVEFASNALAKMDAANEKRRNTPSKTAVANEPLVNRILTEILSTTPMTASEVATALDVSTQKASALLRTLGDQVVVGEAKVPKKGKVKVYSLAE